MSTAAVTPQQDWFSQNAPPSPSQSAGGDWFAQNAPQGAPAQTPSALSRLKDNFLSGFGIGSDEDAKNFFEHPLNTMMGSVKGQDALYQKAKDAYNRGDYKGAVIHGLNYLVPFIGQQTDKAGEQLQQGDYAGGIGRTLGVGTSIAAADATTNALTPETPTPAGFTPTATPTSLAAKAKTALRATGKVATAAGDSLDPDVVGLISPRTAHALRLAQKVGKVANKYGTEAAPEAESTGAPIYRDATRENVPFAGEEEPVAAAEQAQPAAAQTATPTPNFPKPDTSPQAIEQLLNEATGGKPLQPNVSLRNQASAAAPKTSLPEGFTPVKSSALKGYKYDPATQHFEVIYNNGARIGRVGITPDQVAAFEDANSKGTAWNILKDSPGVTYTKNGVARATRVANRSASPEDVAPGEEAEGPASSQAASQPAASPKTASAAPEDDLTSLLQQSLENVNLKKNGYVQTTADPGELSKRWGVDEDSLANGREQTRGMTPEQTEEYVQKLSERYKQGFPVEPVMETRDANNNIIEVDGRARAIAAQRAGVKRIPIIVRRMPAKIAQ